ncbi:MAG: SulP family inorganic anion transporter, partial [Actinomycetota bacterium]|nr:SulP family inorganic anion transporter [Actinomycetota bacterium]
MTGPDRPAANGASRRSATAWMPGLRALLEYRTSWWRSDLFAGAVLAAFLVPVGMGYAEAAGLPVITGLYATIV